MAGARTTKDFQFIVVAKSKLDGVRSKPDKGLYFFDKKKRQVYSVKRDGRLQDKWFRWINRNPVRMNEVMNTMNYTLVRKDDDVVPEGIQTNEEGEYQFGDLVLMWCPLDEWLERRIAHRKKQDGLLKSAKKSFQDTVGAYGGSLDDETLDNIMKEVGGAL